VLDNFKTFLILDYILFLLLCIGLTSKVRGVTLDHRPIVIRTVYHSH